jgi:hypothetical protein
VGWQITKQIRRNIMKKIVVLGLAWILQGLNAFGQTNTVPLTSHLIPHPELRGQTAVAGLDAAGVSAISARSILSRRAEIQPMQSAKFRRIMREGLLLPRIPKNDPGAALETIFWSESDRLSDTAIRDPLVTIFPPGR